MERGRAIAWVEEGEGQSGWKTYMTWCASSPAVAPAAGLTCAKRRLEGTHESGKRWSIVGRGERAC